MILSLENLGENTGKSLLIATVWLLLRHFTKIFGFSNGNDLRNILRLVLNLFMRSEVFLVLIKLSARSCCRVKFSNDKILLFSEWPKTNILN